MSSIFGGSGSSSTDAAPPKDLNARKEAVMASVRNELALANAQELINKTNDKCFAKCVTKPSTSLSSSEETCLSRCFDRYMEAFNIISHTYAARLTKERLEGQV
ncbi:Tim10/DDP family zinc finger-domain-containing protein [Lactarius hatsudake]|uniref:Mitochondrial import inner membrane translocase subunit n=1 Tax=Lactarius akahatsu TaxID=416441 RepID=A0AAD4QCD4_9AGAM|nr:Tim10/DDP family zinc finger-domain-containing protein [Lactarius hatsudake]KAH8994793.1 Tim10/DDP family zinc finger-domain-containing protein [Lactarius akahatsu]